jgi:FtsP/CotA-like multicopper oxidase with cupredoxin domain
VASSDGPGFTRRGFLRGIGLGGVAGVAGVSGAHAVGHLEPDYQGTIGASAVHDGSLYGAIHEAPSKLTAAHVDAVTVPPAPGTVGADLDIDVVERRIEVGAGAFVDAWTYGGQVPGPTIRATVGDRVRIRLRNLTNHPHSLHLHGRHDPAMDGWEPIPPGGEFVYEIEAGPVGVHPYHCHTAPLAEHVRRGLYGMMIVDPPGGRRPAQEVGLLLSGFTIGDRPNAVVAWNGTAGMYHRYPIKVSEGEPVRVYLVNMVEDEPIASFHLHAQTFGVIPAGMGESPVWHSDVVTLSQAERTILEFVLPARGRYMFHPHQHWLATRGAMGWFAAI